MNNVKRQTLSKLRAAPRIELWFARNRASMRRVLRTRAAMARVGRVAGNALN
jgi:hypothetical protein